MDISKYLYPQKKVDQFEAEVNRIAEIEDVGSRMMAYQELYESYPAKRYANALGRLAEDVGYTGLALLPILLLFPVAFIASPMVAFVTLVPLSVAGLAAGMSCISGRFGRVHDKMYGALKRDEKTVTLDALRQSSHCEAVLAKFPAVKERFREAAIVKLIEAETQPHLQLPAPRLQLEKPARSGATA